MGGGSHFHIHYHQLKCKDLNMEVRAPPISHKLGESVSHKSTSSQKKNPTSSNFHIAASICLSASASCNPLHQMSAHECHFSISLFPVSLPVPTLLSTTALACDVLFSFPLKELRHLYFCSNMGEYCSVVWNGFQIWFLHYSYLWRNWLLRWDYSCVIFFYL